MTTPTPIHPFDLYDKILTFNEILVGADITIDGVTYVEDRSLPYTGSNPEFLEAMELFKQETECSHIRY